MKKVTMYEDSEGRLFESAEKCNLSDSRIQVAILLTKKPLTVKVKSEKVEVQESFLYEYFKTLHANDTVKLKHYFDNLYTVAKKRDLPQFTKG